MPSVNIIDKTKDFWEDDRYILNEKLSNIAQVKDINTPIEKFDNNNKLNSSASKDLIITTLVKMDKIFDDCFKEQPMDLPLMFSIVHYVGEKLGNNYSALKKLFHIESLRLFSAHYKRYEQKSNQKPTARIDLSGRSYVSGLKSTRKAELPIFALKNFLIEYFPGDYKFTEEYQQVSNDKIYFKDEPFYSLLGINIEGFYSELKTRLYSNNDQLSSIFLDTIKLKQENINPNQAKDKEVNQGLNITKDTVTRSIHSNSSKNTIPTKDKQYLSKKEAISDDERLYYHEQEEINTVIDKLESNNKVHKALIKVINKLRLSNLDKAENVANALNNLKDLKSSTIKEALENKKGELYKALNKHSKAIHLTIRGPQSFFSTKTRSLQEVLKAVDEYKKTEQNESPKIL